jgi:hypothetical protein
MQVSNKSLNMKNAVKVFLPVLLAFVLEYTAVIADVAVIFIRNLLSEERTVSSRSINTIIDQAYNQPMNLAYTNLLKYILYLICFGIWYHNEITPEGVISYSFKRNIPSVTVIISLVISGISGQFLVDGALNLVRPFFEEAFAEYDKLVSGVTGASASWVMWFTVIAVAPIAEELLFRGLTLTYCRKCLPVPLAILFQGFLFGLYHGNVIQGIYAFALGSVLGLIAYRTDSVIPGMILHVSLNASLLIVPESLYLTTAGTIISTIIALVVFVVGLYFSLRKKKA